MSRKFFLLVAILGQFCTVTPALARDVTFFVFSAPHYGYNETLDKLNLVNIQALNGLPGSSYPDDLGTIDVPRGVLITGDITQGGTQEEFDQFVADYGLTGTEGLINYPVFEVRGNHDWDFEVDPVADGITSRHGGLTYSFDWDDVHIAACDLRVDDQVLPDLRVDESVLAWLEKDLAAVGPYKPVIIYTHFSMTLDGRWTYGLDEYEQLIRKYNVVGSFHNYIEPQHLVWRGFDEYIVSAPFREHPGFVVVHLTDNQMVVANYVWTKEQTQYEWTGGYWLYNDVKAIAPPPVTLTVDKVNEQFGSVFFDPAPWDANRPEYPLDTEVTLTAAPLAQREFVHWEIFDPNRPGDANYAVVDANNSMALMMDRSREVTAVFVDNFALNVDVQGLGVVALEPDDDMYEPNTWVTLTATPTAGWLFAEWLGDLTGSTNPASINMNADKAVTAVFIEEKDEYVLTVQTTGQGTVDPNSGGYPLGILVQLTATPADGWRFDGWSGDVPDANRTDNPLALTMSRDRSVAASFVEVPPQIFNLTVQADGHGVTMPGSGPYTAGTTVSLYAKPVQGWVFDKWEGDVPADKQTRNPVALAMDQDRALTCCFKESTEDESAAGACFLTPLAAIALIPLGSVLILATPRRQSPRGQTTRHPI